MEKEISKIFKKIFELATFDKTTQTYYINKKDYEILNLSDKKIRKNIIEKCEEIGINLEYPNKPLPEIKDEELFEEYNQIQSILKNNPSEEEKQKLEPIKIALRNKITTDNLELIKTIINRRLNEIHSDIDKDDIYQLGYEMLIIYIDENYLDKEKIKYDINCKLILYIKNKMLYVKKNISNYQEEQISILKRAKEEKQNIIPDELSKELGIKSKKIENFFNLENILLSASINEEIERITTEEDSPDEEPSVKNYSQQSTLYTDTFEETLIDDLVIKEYITLIIETLPKEKQNILNLYYGLNGNSSYNMPQIAKIYGITKSGVSSTIKEALHIIRNSHRIKLLKEIYEIPCEYGQEQDCSLSLELEEFLIRNLPTEILIEISKDLKEKESKFLYLYCQQNKYSISEIAKILNISKPHTYEIKNKVLKTIRNKIVLQRKSDKYITDDEYYQYIKYLMNIYSHQSKIRKRKK